MTMEAGPWPALKGDPVMAVRTPVSAAISKAETLSE